MKAIVVKEDSLRFMIVEENPTDYDEMEERKHNISTHNVSNSNCQE